MDVNGYNAAPLDVWSIGYFFSNQTLIDFLERCPGRRPVLWYSGFFFFCTAMFSLNKLHPFWWRQKKKRSTYIYTLSLSPDAWVADLSIFRSSMSESSAWKSSPTDSLNTFKKKKKKTDLTDVKTGRLNQMTPKACKCISLLHVDDECVGEVA